MFSWKLHSNRKHKQQPNKNAMKLLEVINAIKKNKQSLYTDRNL